MKIFLNSLGFLTIFRISRKVYVNDNLFYKTLYYFPLAGFLIGIFCSTVYFISGFVFPGFLCLIFTVIAEVFISGGMHLDGLSDTADGIFSGKAGKEKIVEIMKKSDIGVFGVISLVFLLILKIALLYSIFSIAFKNIETINLQNTIKNTTGISDNIHEYFTVLPSFNITLLINFAVVFSLMPAISRWTINLQFARFGRFSFPGSMTEIFLKKKSKKIFIIPSLYLFLLVIISNAAAGYFLKENFLFNSFSRFVKNYSASGGNLLFFWVIPVIKCSIIIMLIILFAETAGRFLIRRIGRLSGDAIGAVVEITEIIYLFLIYIFIFIF